MIYSVFLFQVRLFIEEVDKITSLIIGLSSRLVRLSYQPTGHRDIDQRTQVIHSSRTQGHRPEDTGNT
jgi:hypothetical protein